jgi:hypothetical protein
LRTQVFDLLVSLLSDLGFKSFGKGCEFSDDVGSRSSGGGGSSSAIGPEAVAEIQKLRSELHSLKNELGVENKDERPTT